MSRSLRVLPSIDLDDVRVATPCPAEWSDMVGSERVRFCGGCQKNVYNLSGMRRDEAVDLLRATEGRVCVRFFRRRDGTVLTEDCPVGVALLLKKAKRATLVAAATSVAAVAALLAVLGSVSRPACERLEVLKQSIIEVTPSLSVPNVMGEATAPEPMQGGLAPLPQAPPREIMGKMAVRPEVQMGDVMLPKETKGEVALDVE